MKAADREEAVAAIASAAAETERAKESLAESITTARVLRVTWEEIGDALGTSRQNAHRKYGPLVDRILVRVWREAREKA